MPGQSGYELTKELKESKNIPIILLTAKGEVESRIHGLELGADDYLGKPFDPKELLLRVKNVIKMNIDPNTLLSSKIGEAELNLNPQNTVKVKNSDSSQIINLLSILEDHEDIQKVYTNLEIEDINDSN